MLLGGVVLLGCAGLSCLLAWIALVHLRSDTSLLGRGVLGLCAPLFALAARWGGQLALRGVRGVRLVSERALRRDHALQSLLNGVGLFVLMAAAVLVFVLSGGRPWPSSAASSGGNTVAWYLLTSELWLLPAVLLHELGHAAAASALGVGWTTLRIGPFEVLREGGRTRVRWQLRGAASMLGYVQLDPRAFQEAPSRMAWVVLAGPATSGLCAAIHVAVAHALGSTGPGDAQGLSALLWGGAFIHAGSCLFNLLPVRVESGHLSDGALWLVLRQWRIQSEGMRLLGTLQSESLTLRPRQWSLGADALLAAASAPGESAEARGWLQLYALAWWLDRGELAPARALLERLAPTLDTLPEPCPRELRLQGALLHALDGPDTARARSFLAAVDPHSTHPLYPRLAEAAVLWSEGREADARAALQAWQEARQASGMAEQWCIGNQWALERLYAALGQTAPTQKLSA